MKSSQINAYTNETEFLWKLTNRGKKLTRIVGFLFSEIAFLVSDVKPGKWKIYYYIIDYFVW